jgi:hypothetical protein
MSDERIATHIWVGAKLRQCSALGMPAVVVHSGERMGGTVMLKVYQPGVGCRLLAQTRDLDGRLGWYKAHKDELVAEPEADALIERAIGRDPDLWVIEVETRDGHHPFEDI